MALSIYNIKRWIKMLTGTSIYHVNQGLGKAISSQNKLEGYYNDLTLKVIQGDKNLDENGIPFLVHSDGLSVHMPTMIFQYGLGAYDLWLLTKEEEYLGKARLCAEWAIRHQIDNGSWNNFFYIYPDAPYSAMAQGEGASLLLRVAQETSNQQMLQAAKRAIDFMLTDVKNGGVAKYLGDELYFLEYTHLPLVLNGWIFAIFGLYDLTLVLNEAKYSFALETTISTLIKKLEKFDCRFWSLYDESGKIASPFYHKLHIAQLQALYTLTQNKNFIKYSEKWMDYQKNLLNRNRAFVKKAYQKILD